MYATRGSQPPYNTKSKQIPIQFTDLPLSANLNIENTLSDFGDFMQALDMALDNDYFKCYGLKATGLTRDDFVNQVWRKQFTIRRLLREYDV